MATKSKTKDDGDAPLIDLNEASVKKLIAKAKKKGYVTYDELNDALPQGEMSSDQIEDIQSALSDMGVQIVESDEDAEAAAEEADEVEEITTDTKKDSKAAAKPMIRVEFLLLSGNLETRIAITRMLSTPRISSSPTNKANKPMRSPSIPP